MDGQIHFPLDYRTHVGVDIIELEPVISSDSIEEQLVKQNAVSTTSKAFWASSLAMIKGLHMFLASEIPSDRINAASIDNHL